MAHELEIAGGKGSMAYVGARPWHGYGQILQPGADLEEWRVAARLDWEYVKKRAYYKIDETEHEIPDRWVIYKSDNGRWLSLVGDNFNVVQPDDILMFYKNLIKYSGFEMETAGYLDLGRRVWALAKTGDKGDVRKGDEVHGYVLLATACDGSLATTCTFTSIRVVCNNTLSYAIEQTDHRKDLPCIKVRHTSRFDPDLIKVQLGLGQKSFLSFMEKAKILSNKFITTKDLDTLILATFGKKEEDEVVVPERVNDKVIELFESGPGSNLPSASGTAWGFVNATTHYIDHARIERVRGGRQNTAWFGEGAITKGKAFRSALALATD